MERWSGGYMIVHYFFSVLFRILDIFMIKKTKLRYQVPHFG